jgi:N-acetyl-anhydromuramyl-L-alanine amidase AmpD
VAPARKQDPGELLDWPWLASQGIGVWPGERAGLRRAPAETATLILRLRQYGYDDGTPVEVIAAFQRHFRPALVDGQADAECLSIAEALLTAS